MRRATRVAGAAVAVALVSGCGGGVDAAGVAASQGAGGVGSGGAAADPDGAFDVADGGELDSDSGALPDGFPDDLPLPDGLRVTTAVATGASSFEVHGMIDGGDVPGILTELTAALEADGWTPEQLEVDGTPVGLRATRGDSRYEVQLTDLGEPPLLVLLSVRTP